MAPSTETTAVVTSVEQQTHLGETTKEQITTVTESMEKAKVMDQSPVKAFPLSQSPQPQATADTPKEAR